MREPELAFAPAHELRELIVKKRLSPVELTETYLRRIEALDPRLNAFLTVVADEAMRAAREAEAAVTRGDQLGRLHGITIGIKDLVPTKGIRTTQGSLVFKDWVPDQDDVSVERIKAAGAIILGKTNTPEFGSSGTTENHLGDDCRNPWNPERVSGGSSGGSASALAAGLCPLATGSDAGGSIRIPASFCGVYGVKTTQGRVPQRYSTPNRWLPINFDQIGPMSRSVRDAADLMQVLAGPHPDYPLGMQEEPPNFAAGLGRGVKGIRVAWSPDLGSAAVDSEVLEVVRGAVKVFEELGAAVEPADMHLDYGELTSALLALSGISGYLMRGRVFEEHGDQLVPYVHRNLSKGKVISGLQYAQASSVLEQHRASIGGLFTQYDLLLTPTMAVAAFPLRQRPEVIGGKTVDQERGYNPFTFPFNMSGNPAASIPCGFSPEGLPIGLQIVGRNGDEVTVLQASAAFEEARPWTDKRPAVS